jgi:hypothetical protein
VNGEALTEKLRVPRHLDIDAVSGYRTRPSSKVRGGSHRHGRFSDDHRRARQPRHECVDNRMDLTQVGAVLAFLLRCADPEEMDVGEVGGELVISGESQPACSQIVSQ